MIDAVMGILKVMGKEEVYQILINLAREAAETTETSVDDMMVDALESALLDK